jgi:hypothetical protein
MNQPHRAPAVDALPSEPMDLSPLSSMTVEFVRLNERHYAARQRHFW